MGLVLGGHGGKKKRVSSLVEGLEGAGELEGPMSQ